MRAGWDWELSGRVWHGAGEEGLSGQFAQDVVEDLGVHGFGEVADEACFGASLFVGAAAVAGEGDAGEVGELSAEFAHEVEAAFALQADVTDDDVECVFPGGAEGGLGGADGHHGVPHGGEQADHGAGGLGHVFDKQDAHGFGECSRRGGSIGGLTTGGHVGREAEGEGGSDADDGVDGEGAAEEFGGL